jgi:hypothetical protein
VPCAFGIETNRNIRTYGIQCAKVLVPLLQERLPYLQVFYAQKPVPTLVNIATKYSVVYELIWPKSSQLQMLHFVPMMAKFVQDPVSAKK